MNVCLPPCCSQYRCTDVEVIDSEHHRTTGLAPGQYACWNPVEYNWCPSSSPPPPSPPPPSPPIWPKPIKELKTITGTEQNVEGGDDGMDDGTVAGIAVACLLAGLLIGGGVVFLRFKWSPIVKRHKSFEVDVAERRKEEEKGVRTENV